MKIDEAIKILSDEPETIDYENDPVALKALNLGIEVLKWLSIWRSGEYVNWHGPLPGETYD